MSSTTHNPTSSKHLEDQAAAAALYVTEPQRQTRDVRKEANWPLDANGKLTSASAATSLKRADAKDLPSFPSVGIAQSAAGGAALLANQNTKSPEWWKPEASAGASKAALAAHDYKMKPLWQPEASAAGSKAAVLAHQKGHGLNLWEPTSSDKALIAATGAISGKTSKKETISEFGIDRYPDERNAARNALSAASVVHSNSVRSRNQDLGGMTDAEAEKIRKQATTNLGADLYGSAPVIGPELEDRKHQAGLHAAAVSMAQGMYGKRDEAYRQKLDAARAGSRAAHARGLEQDSDDEDGPMSFMGLHEAAQKLAEKRLAAMRDPNEEYREHYGTNTTSPPKSRLSMFGGGSQRRRDSDDEDDDRKNSRRIRGEMNLFQDKLKEIDARKRKDDRDALLVAAQRNVRASIADMDEDVFQRTGKMSPAMRADWEEKARQRAQAESENRNANYGKVALGGGKYMDQTEIDAIAQARLQPTLDAVTAKAEHDREVDEQNRLEEAERKRIERENKEEEKYKDMKIKEEWKRFRAEEKAEKRAHKQEEQEHKQEEKQAAKDAKMQHDFEKRKEKEEMEEVKQYHKEEEKEAHAAEKEKDKHIKEEWKAFKQQEKEEERVRKEEQRSSKGSRLSGLFRRKSKKETEPRREGATVEDTVIPAGAATTTTTISAEPAGASQTQKATTSAAVDAPTHHPEPHHNPLMPVEETPEARAANKQKPGGDLIQIFKRKKQEHDEKRHSQAEAATAGAATGAIVGAEASALTGKDEPGKAQASTGRPISEALAPENVASEQAAKPSATQATASEPEPITVVASSTAPLITSRIESGSLDQDPEKLASFEPVSPPEQTGGKHESVVPASAAAATITSDKVDRAEKPAISDAGHGSSIVAEDAPVAVTSNSPALAPPEKFEEPKPAPAAAPVAAPLVVPAPAPEPMAQTTQTSFEQPAPIVHDKVAPIPAPASDPTPEQTPAQQVTEAPTKLQKAAEPATSASEAQLPTSRQVENSSTTPIAAPTAATTSTAPAPAVGPQSASPAAIGSTQGGSDQIIAMGTDKPVTQEVRHSLVDKVDPRVNAGKPGFEGSEKVASVFADMRGTDHAGANVSPTAEAAPAAEKEMAQNESAQTAEAASPAAAAIGTTGTAGTASSQQATRGAAATTEGQKRETPLAERIAVPAAATQAAHEAAASNQKGTHDSPRTTEQKKTNRLSGFFRNKFGSKIKEHKGSDGVTVTPTTQYTTKGKYVDPEDKHVSTRAAATPANTTALEQGSSSAGAGSASAAGAAATTTTTTTTTTTAHETHHTDASGIAIDPEYQSHGAGDVSPLSEDDRGRILAVEEHDEARDKFDADKLPLPKAPAVQGASESPARDSRFKEELFA